MDLVLIACLRELALEVVGVVSLHMTSGPCWFGRRCHLDLLLVDADTGCKRVPSTLRQALCRLFRGPRCFWHCRPILRPALDVDNFDTPPAQLPSLFLVLSFFRGFFGCSDLAWSCGPSVESSVCPCFFSWARVRSLSCRRQPWSATGHVPAVLAATLTASATLSVLSSVCSSSTQNFQAHFPFAESCPKPFRFVCEASFNAPQIHLQ